MGDIIALVETQGTISNTLLGANIAAALSLQAKKSCVLCDLASSSREAPRIITGTTLSKGISDLVALLTDLDPSLLRGYLPSSNGVALVGADAEEIHLLDSAKTRQLLSLLSETFDYVIVSAPRSENTVFFELCDTADFVFLSILPHTLALTQVKYILKSLEGEHIDLKKFSILAESTGSPHELSHPQIEEYLGLRVAGNVPGLSSDLISSINSSKLAVISSPHSPFSDAIRGLTKRIVERDLPGSSSSSRSDRTVSSTRHGEEQDSARLTEELLIRLKQKLHRQLVEEMNRRNVDTGALNRSKETDAIRDLVKSTLQELLAKEQADLSRECRASLIDDLLDEILGLGCIEEHLKNPEVTEIMVNGADRIYIERKGRLYPTRSRFTSDTHLRTVIERIVSPIGRRIDESSPLVDARLTDGSRVNAVIPPLALDGPCLTIRKFSHKKLTVDDLISFGALVRSMADFLSIAVRLRKNLIISGGTGSGKTTLLNVISSFIPPDERIVTIEDSAELKLPQDHVVRLETRPPSIEGTGEIPIRRLVINALRMRPDRIVVGECRGGEALDMLQAMNTGHDGSLTTVHANSPRDSIARIATMAIMAGADLPEKAIREQICSAVNIVVQLSRLSDGSRKITEIAEITGIKNDAVSIVPLFKYRQTGVRESKVNGVFTATGNAPSFLDSVQAHGLSLDPMIFKEGELAP